MGRFQVGETVEFWTPYGADGHWEKTEVVRIRSAPSGEPLVSVRDPREPGADLEVPNPFLRKVVSGDGLKYPPVVYPANEFLMVRVDFPQQWDGDGTGQAVKFVFTLENTWTGAGRKIESWIRSWPSETGGPEVSSSMVWGFDNADRDQQCSVMCRDSNCGVSGFHNDVQRVARSCAGLTVVLQGELARGKTHEEALSNCHAKFVLEANHVMSAAERATLETSIANDAQRTGIPDSVLARVAAQLGIDPENMQVIDLGGNMKNPNA